MAYYEIKFPDNLGYKEIDEVADLLRLYSDGKLSRVADAYWSSQGLTVGYNDMSGMVFLVNEDSLTLVEREGLLDLFISTSWSGQEGTLEEHIEAINDYPHQYDFDDLEELQQYEEYLDKNEKEIFRNAIQEKTV